MYDSCDNDPDTGEKNNSYDENGIRKISRSCLSIEFLKVGGFLEGRRKHDSLFSMGLKRIFKSQRLHVGHMIPRPHYQVTHQGGRSRIGGRTRPLSIGSSSSNLYHLSHQSELLRRRQGAYMWGWSFGLSNRSFTHWASFFRWRSCRILLMTGLWCRLLPASKFVCKVWHERSYRTGLLSSFIGAIFTCKDICKLGL